MFFRTLVYMFLSEMGDKTQLLMVALTAKYKKRDIILGVFLAALVLNGASVFLGSLIADFLPTYLISSVSALMFLAFAYMTLMGGEGKEEQKENDLRGAAAVFISFFIAELGDKTQMSAIAFGAEAGREAALLTVIACTLGLFLSDMAGFGIGYLLKAQYSERAVGILSFSVFSVFGILSLRRALSALDAAGILPMKIAGTFPLFVAVYVLLCLISGAVIKSREHKFKGKIKQ